VVDVFLHHLRTAPETSLDGKTLFFCNNIRNTWCALHSGQTRIHGITSVEIRWTFFLLLFIFSLILDFHADMPNYKSVMPLFFIQFWSLFFWLLIVFLIFFLQYFISHHLVSFNFYFKFGVRYFYFCLFFYHFLNWILFLISFLNIWF
jgi:hypothetical protein